eukprot:CAMPEP_0184302424 /NCGR_PEP_ID=MMETSP1049-20130417/12407_1 /TAXON_ID=77928 /ORGANISM="Proteomonas sulcata, Strain CCMP704" /LENGTH=38 /DNA_ID= /DNA_START= /DNA_END= /DNA_ORIENTATION=
MELGEPATTPWAHANADPGVSPAEYAEWFIGDTPVAEV